LSLAVSTNDVSRSDSPGEGNRQVAAIFNDAASVYDAASNPYTMRRRVEAIVPHVVGRSLEVGGGTAAVTSALSDKSHALHSDISLRMCCLARKKASCRSVCFDAETIPLRDGSIDTLISSEMIYYLQRPDQFVTEAHRVLATGGQLVISATNPMATILERGRTVLRMLGFKNMFFDDGSPVFLPMRRIVSMLQEARFFVEKKYYIIPLPFAVLDWANRILERTPLKYLGLFMIIVAKKQ